MKKLSSVLLWVKILILQQLFAQPNKHLILSDLYPKAGESIEVVYDPAIWPVGSKSNLNAVVYFLDNKDYPVADLDLKQDGNFLKADFSIPAAAKAFFIKISKDGDDNNDYGYLYMIYKDKKPIEGAYASKAYVLFSGMGNVLAKIKTDPKEAFSLFQQEFQNYPQSEKNYRTMYFALLTSAHTYDFTAVLNQKLNMLMKSNDETDLIVACNSLRGIGKNVQADSLAMIVKAKYPNGELVKSEVITAFNTEADPVEKEILYNEYVKKYPINTADHRKSSGGFQALHDSFNMQSTFSFLLETKDNNYFSWQKQLEGESLLLQTLNTSIYDWAKKGEHLAEATIIAKQSLNLIMEKVVDPGFQPYASPKMLKERYVSYYNTFADTYAFILFKQHKFEEALSYEQPVYEKLKGNDVEINEHYTQMLMAAGKEQKAKQIIEVAVKNNKNSDLMDVHLKAIYLKAKGSDVGYEPYIVSLKTKKVDDFKTSLYKKMINKPAPAFTLKDLDGNTVTLERLKGKVVVIDFWATWCGPCINSFPAMQTAVNRYKDNPNVKFLFIDTWERSDNYLDSVKKFITNNNYNLTVLVDEKNDNNKQAKVVSTYKVEAIPTTFILDKQGQIRFRNEVFEGTAEDMENKISIMIELASNPNRIK